MCQQVIPGLDMKLETRVSRLEVNNLNILPNTNRKVEGSPAGAASPGCQTLGLCRIDPSDTSPTQ